MKTRIILLVLALTIYTTLSFAQGLTWWTGSSGWGPGSEYCRLYDPKTVETIKGEVLSVEKFRPQEGMAYGIHLLIKSDKETISIHLGPEWFIAAQDTKIQPKGNIEVKGSRMTHRFFGDNPFIVAARVKKGDEVLVLRDDNGLPVWQAWRRGLI